MLTDEIYFFGLIAIITLLLMVIVFWLYRLYIEKNRIEAIREQKELLHSDDYSSKTK